MIMSTLNFSTSIVLSLFLLVIPPVTTLAGDTVASVQTAQGGDTATVTQPSKDLKQNTDELSLFERKLELYARMVQTYGLAVFLVLFYVTVVWPRQNKDRESDRKERTAWITQITRLRELIDPTVKKLTREQVRTVLNLAMAGQMDRLSLLAGFTSKATPDIWSTDSVGRDHKKDCCYLLGKKICFNMVDKSDTEKLRNEFESVFNDIEDLLKEEGKFTKDFISKLMDELTPYAQRVELRLNTLYYEDTTLGAIFRECYSNATDVWNKVGNAIPEDERRDIERAESFIKRFDDKANYGWKNYGVFRNISYYSFQDTKNQFQSAFEQAVEIKLIPAGGEVRA